MNAPRTLAVDYDVYEIAYLAGGPCRAVEAAVVALAESGRIAVDRSTGQLSVVDGRGRHWLETAVLEAVAHRGYRMLETLRWRLANDELLASVRQRLQGDGLLRRSASTPRSTRAWQTLALTGQGRRTLRDLRERPSAEAGGGLSVALGGPRAVSDDSLRTALFDPPPPAPLPSRRSFRRDPYLPGYESSTVSAAALGFWAVSSEMDGWGGGGGGWGADGGGGDGGGGE